MITYRPSSYLRRVLFLNAAGNGVLGAAAIVLTKPLSVLLGLSDTVLGAAGIYLLVYAGLVGWLACRDQLSSMSIWILMAFNAVWSFESIALVALGIIRPTGLGTLVICAEGWIALMFVELQHAGLRRSTQIRVHAGRPGVIQS